MENKEDNIITKDPVYQRLEKIIYIDSNREQSRYSPRWYVSLISQSLLEKMKKRQMTKKEYRTLYRMSIPEMTNKLWNRGTSFLE